MGEEEGNSPDMILVPVGQKDAADLVLSLEEIGEIRNDHVDSEHLGFGGHLAAINDDNVIIPFEEEAIHAEFADPAQGQGFQGATVVLLFEKRIREGGGMFRTIRIGGDD